MIRLQLHCCANIRIVIIASMHHLYFAKHGFLPSRDPKPFKVEIDNFPDTGSGDSLTLIFGIGFIVLLICFVFLFALRMGGRKGGMAESISKASSVRITESVERPASLNVVADSPAAPVRRSSDMTPESWRILGLYLLFVCFLIGVAIAIGLAM